ncbi:MAG TPA: 50S ribosomal protein L21 [Gemmatimonadales bacterium]|nr:50S ribosomal protein L21 [Gemmatimonadales bacterium]
MSYAIFKAAGQQFRAEKGATVRVPLLKAEPGSKVTFDEVLLSSDGKKISAGQPTVKGAKVTAEVVRHGQDDKIYVFRFKRRKNYRRKTGHRADFTELKITDVKVG